MQKFFTISSPDNIERAFHQYLNLKEIRHKLNPYKYDFPFTISSNRMKFRILKIDEKTSCVRFDNISGSVDEFNKNYKEIRDGILTEFNKNIL